MVSCIHLNLDPALPQFGTFLLHSDLFHFFFLSGLKRAKNSLSYQSKEMLSFAEIHSFEISKFLHSFPLLVLYSEYYLKDTEFSRDSYISELLQGIQML